VATRYWVLGSGTWDLTTTTNWSATSGGTGGASAPTSADDVIFDAGSNVGTGAFTVTIGAAGAVCRDISFGGAGGALDGVMTLAGSGAWSVYGSMTLVSANLTFSYGGITTFAATTTGKTITTAAKSFTLGNGIIFNGVGGGWTLQDACTFYKITLTAGALDTNNQTVSLSAGVNGFITSGSTTRSLTLGTSTVSLSGIIDAWSVSSTTGFTLSAASSTLNFTGGSNDIVGGGLTYGTITVNASSGTIAGANTITTLNLNATTGTSLTISAAQNITTLNSTTLTSGINVITCSANQTIGTINTNSNVSLRTFFVSNTLGTARTFTITTRPVSNIDFRDITIAGTVLTGTSFGDCGGNSNITFDAAKTVYWNLAGTQNWSATGWATSSGGSPAAANFPLAQDTVTFDNTGSVTGTITVNASYNIGTVNITKTGSMTLSLASNRPQVYGSFTLGALTTLTGGNGLFLSGRSTTQTITTNTRTFGSASITVQALSSTITFADTFTTTGALTHNNGTLNLNNLTITAAGFTSASSSTRAITFGTTGAITVNGSGSFFITVVATGLTTTGTPTLNISNNSGTASSFYFTGFTESTAFNVNVTTGTYTLTEGSSSVYKNLNFTGFAGTFTGYSFGGNTIYGNLTTSTGMSYSASTFAMTFAATSGTQTITSNAKTMDFPITFNGSGGTFQLVDALTSGSGRTMTLTSGTLDLNDKTLTTGLFSSSNSNTRSILFGTTGNITCSGTGTVWTTSTITNFSYTGTSTVNLTDSSSTLRSIIQGAGTAAQAVSFYIKAGTGQVSLTTTSGAFKDIDFTGSTAILGVGSSINCFGNIVLTNNTTASGFGLTFAGTSGTQTMTSNGKTFDCALTMNGVGGTLQLVDALTMGSTRTLTLTNGTFNSNAKSVTVGAFNANNSNTKTFTITNSTFTVLSGTSTSGFLLNGVGTTYNVTGSNVVFTTSTAAQYWGGGGSTFPAVTMSGTGQLIIGANGSTLTITTLSNTVQPCTVSIFSTNTQLNVTNFNLSGTAGNLVTFNSSVAGTARTISKASGTVSCDYLSIRDSTATGGASWYAGTNSTNVSNNTGWIFASPVITVAVTENFSIADSPNVVASFVVSISERSTLEDTPSVVASFLSNITENFTIEDKPVYVAVADITEGTILADTLTGLATFATAITEDATLADSSIVLRTAFGDISELLILADTPNTTAAFLSNVTEPLTLADTPVGNAVFAGIITENTTLADTQSVNAVFASAITEAATLADAQSVVLAIVSDISEAITLADSQTVIANFASVVFENVGVAESESVVASFTAVISEGAVLEDVESVLASFVSSLSEALTAADSSIAVRIQNSSITEDFQPADTQTALRIHNALISENLVPADAITVIASFSSQITENLVLLDSPILRGWFKINDDQTVSWGAVNNTNSAAWAAVNDGQTVSWNNVNNANSTTWTNIGDDQNPVWTSVDNTQ